jgi:hypothetical protein
MGLPPVCTTSALGCTEKQAFDVFHTNNAFLLIKKGGGLA